MKHLYEKATDEDLAKLTCDNPDIYEILVARYWQRLFRYIRRISYFSEEDAEDILQESFIKIYKGIKSFDDSLKFSTWAYQIVRNCTIDAIRKKHSRPQSIYLENSDFIKIFKSETNIKDKIVLKDYSEKINEIINNLPFKYKEVMILKFLEQKSYEEIMDIIKKPKGTVAALINRGRKMIIKEADKQGLSLIDIYGK